MVEFGYVTARHEERVTIWMDGIEDIDVPITESMPEWMLEGQQFFTTTYPRRFRRQRKIPSDFVNWGPFEILPGIDMTEEELLSGIVACFSAECIVTYRCGHQEQVTISASVEHISQRIADYARLLCHSCQIAREQQQFEEVIQQANQAYNVTDQNGCLITARLSRPGFCQVTMQYEGEAPFYEEEIEIAQVTAELHRRDRKDLYWSDKDWGKLYKKLQ